MMATPFFFKTGIEPVRKVIWAAVSGPLKQAAEDFGWEEYSTDWRAVCGRPDIDVVDIVTPPNTHAEMAIAAAEAGKHIFCEKPFTVTSRSRADAGGGPARRRQAHAGLQLPPRAGTGPGQAVDRIGDAWEDLPFPRGVPAGLDHGPAVSAHLEAEPGDGRFGTAPRTEQPSDRPGAVPGRQDRRVVGMEETFIKQRPAEAAGHSSRPC
jgi:hypothetical protein